ncbi:unnamed protein product [Arctia plantaginis]|uniref:Uncharacterized protein n=1 Tax=Arctia plantaginis TaxID=874455 RepID=A0A8S0YNW7_ARCPL|nr:unnamed protein product [Arctia plantaginis]
MTFSLSVNCKVFYDVAQKFKRQVAFKNISTRIYQKFYGIGTHITDHLHNPFYKFAKRRYCEQYKDDNGCLRVTTEIDSTIVEMEPKYTEKQNVTTIKINITTTTPEPMVDALYVQTIIEMHSDHFKVIDDVNKVQSTTPYLELNNVNARNMSEFRKPYQHKCVGARGYHFPC